MDKKYKTKLGKKGEETAVKFLERKGFKILARNYHYGHKEIDIIGKEKNTIVFVEVKTAQSKSFGSPVEWVNIKKQKQIIQVGEAFIQEKDLKDCDFRFDVVAIQLDGKTEKIQHIESAFMIP